jgi:hypothetical protein
MPSDADAISGLIFAEARAALEYQRSVVEALRVRAAFVFSAATVVISLLGGSALAHGGLSPWTWAGLGCFVGVWLLALAAHWPASQISPGVRPHAIVSAYLDAHLAPRVAEVHRGLAASMERTYALNEQRVWRLVSCVRTASILLTLEALWWVVSVMSGA